MSTVICGDQQSWKSFSQHKNTMIHLHPLAGGMHWQRMFSPAADSPFTVKGIVCTSRLVFWWQQQSHNKNKNNHFMLAFECWSDMWHTVQYCTTIFFHTSSPTSGLVIGDLRVYNHQGVCGSHYFLSQVVRCCFFLTIRPAACWSEVTVAGGSLDWMHPSFWRSKWSFSHQRIYS